MSDDTATVELRELGEELNHRGFHNFANRCYEAADLIEQQARAIAELRFGLNHNADLVKTLQGTIAEQAATIKDLKARIETDQIAALDGT